jgi:hypothetical protein
MVRKEKMGRCSIIANMGEQRQKEKGAIGDENDMSQGGKT